MKRRKFLQQPALGGCALLAAQAAAWGGLAPLAHAQGSDFIEGRDFRRLTNPAPVPGHGKIDVVEFFWYGCPHVHPLEPALDGGVARSAADGGILRRPGG